MNIKHTIFTFFLGCSCLAAFAVPAKPGLTVTEIGPDGQPIEVKVIGDEHFRYFKSHDNATFVRESSGRLRRTDMAEIESLREQKIQSKGLRVASDAPRALSRATSDNPSKGIGLFETNFLHSGEQRPLIILAEYSDIKFSVKNPEEYFTRFLNEEGFADYGATGSCRDYFVDNSMGQYRPTFDVYGPVTLPQKRSYYGGNVGGEDKNVEGMIIDACTGLDSKIDFSKYDANGDGYVDNVYVIYAGVGEATSNVSESVWPMQWDLETEGYSLKLDGVNISSYGCCNEWEDGKPAGIGTFCHEFGHVLGLPDLYSTIADLSTTPGDWNIMDSGSYNNDSRTPAGYSAFERNAMGWIDLEVLQGDKIIELPHIGSSNQAAIILTDKANEFFLFENRQKSGWDKYVPGHGLLVWHINYSSSAWEFNIVNNSRTRQNVDIIEANNNPNCYSPSAMAGYTFPGTSGATELSENTSPALLTWSNKSTGLAITDISETAGNITFNVKSTSSTGISDIVSDFDIQNGTLYNLQGIKVEGTPTPGIYLLRTAESTRKIRL